MKRRALARGVGGLLFLVLLAAHPCGAERVVAVGDVHGAYQEFVSILQAAGVIDKDLAWTGGKMILVQTGDVLDRGPRSRDALDLLMDLTEKAPRQGGEVRALLGNHETMVMTGDLRYVTPDDYRSFASADSEKTREKEYENYIKYLRERAARSRKPMAPRGEAEKQAWLEAHPPGYFEFRQAFSPSGKYGRWLRSRDAVTQVGDTIFLHGGLSPELRVKNVKEVNERVRRDLETMDTAWSRLSARGILWPYLNFEEAVAEAKADYKYQQAAGGAVDQDLITFLSPGNLLFASPEGPLWYRGYAQQPEAELAPRLEQVFKRFKIERLVVGHTVPPAKRITPRFNGRVFLIDTGMLDPYFHGRPSALEINGGHFKAIYVGEAAQPLAGNGAAKAQ